jgi:hypothetical protein
VLKYDYTSQFVSQTPWKYIFSGRNRPSNEWSINTQIIIWSLSLLPFILNRLNQLYSLNQPYSPFLIHSFPFHNPANVRVFQPHNFQLKEPNIKLDNFYEIKSITTSKRFCSLRPWRSW